jgi:hypothetical protein
MPAIDILNGTLDVSHSSAVNALTLLRFQLSSIVARFPILSPCRLPQHSISLLHSLKSEPHLIALL